jgi:hypothetical protein
MTCVLSKKGRRGHCAVILVQKPEAPAFWKDLMAWTLRKAREFDPGSSIVFDYRVDDEQVFATATKVPAWFRRLGHTSREFWRLSAQYLLTHPH